MRLLVTGKSRSGKSTALHRLVQTALRGAWSHIFIADGKSVELGRYAESTSLGLVYGEDRAEACAEALTTIADRLTLRYQQLAARNLQKALPDDPRELIIIDEAQEFVRHHQHGKDIRKALTRIFEKSGALGDLVIVATQRGINGVPPAVRYNASAQLRMLGLGYFQLVVDGQPTQQGRIDPDAALVDASLLHPAGLLQVLNAQPTPRAPTPIVLYTGEQGSGRTYALERHTHAGATRRILLDVKANSHRALLVTCLLACGAQPPDDAPIPELAGAAALALTAEPTLLLLDNVDAASEKCRDSLMTLLDAAHAAAMTALPAPPAARPDRAAPLRRRARCVELRPLDADTAMQIIVSAAPDLDDASRNEIRRRSAGHPATIAAYVERVAAFGPQERYDLAPPRARHWPQLALLVLVLVAIHAIRRTVGGTLAADVLMSAVIIVGFMMRTFIRRAIRT